LNIIVGTYECKVGVASAFESSFVLKRSVFQPCLELYGRMGYNDGNKLNRFVKEQ
jgi:MraZ protein